MLIFALDDEQLMLNALVRSIREALPESDIRAFQRSSALISAVVEENRKPDVCFIDIEMPGMNGLDVARAVLNKLPDANIVFVTGFAQYALEAIELHPSGYIVKPITAQSVRKQMKNLRVPIAERKTGLQARCFGNFDLLYDGVPISFRYQKTKELLAYLIDNRGSSANTAQLCAVLWEDQPDSPSQHAYLRNLFSDLRKQLATVHCEDLLATSRDSFAIDVSKIDCDYYKFLKGDIKAINTYFGEYMRQYSWAEIRLGALDRRFAEINGQTPD